MNFEKNANKKFLRYLTVLTLLVILLSIRIDFVYAPLGEPGLGMLKESPIIKFFFPPNPTPGQPPEPNTNSINSLPAGGGGTDTNYIELKSIHDKLYPSDNPSSKIKFKAVINKNDSQLSNQNDNNSAVSEICHNTNLNNTNKNQTTYKTFQSCNKYSQNRQLNENAHRIYTFEDIHHLNILKNLTTKLLLGFLYNFT